MATQIASGQGCSLCGGRRPMSAVYSRRGRGVVRFRLPPAVTFLGGGDACAARRHWAGLAEGGAGSSRTSRPFLTAADGRGPEEPGRVLRLRSSRGGSGRCGCCVLGPGKEGSCWEPSFNFVCKGPGLKRDTLGNLVYNIIRIY